MFKTKKIDEFELDESFSPFYEFHFNDFSELCRLPYLMLIFLIKSLPKSFDKNPFIIIN
jgi:hypothetical protein